MAKSKTKPGPTPGPWTYSKHHRDMMTGEWTWGVYANQDPDHKMPAECYGPRAEANARLIAAAPDLYEFLKLKAEEVSDKCAVQCDCWCCEFYDEVTALLKKVEDKTK